MSDAQAFIERCFSTSHGHLQSREPARQQIADDVELFLANGGKIIHSEILMREQEKAEWGAFSIAKPKDI